MEFKELSMATEKDKKGENYIVHLNISMGFRMYHWLMQCVHGQSLEQEREYDLTTLLLVEWSKDYRKQLDEKKRKKD